MRRREFIAGLGGAAAWPVAARAQQRMPVIGYVSGGSEAPFRPQTEAFRRGLGKSGFIEGRNVEFCIVGRSCTPIDCPRSQRISWRAVSM
jgi:hypothetical protein